MASKFPKFGYNPITGEWNDSLRGDFLWSGVNYSEAVPDVMTPMTWSRLWIYFNRTDPHQWPGDCPPCGNICGRLYVNLSLISSLYRAFGRDARKGITGDLIGSAPARLDIPFIPFSPLVVIWKVLPGRLKDRWHTRRDMKQFPNYITFRLWCINREMGTIPPKRWNSLCDLVAFGHSQMSDSIECGTSDHGLRALGFHQAGR
jgi:hypothetical protein